MSKYDQLLQSFEANLDGDQKKEVGISVVVPIFGTEFANILATSVENFRRQNCDNLEVIFVLGDEVDRQNINSNNARIRYVKTSGRNPALLRNFGALCAKYRYIAFVDADIIIPDAHWASRILDRLISQSDIPITAIPRRRIVNREIRSIMREYINGKSIDSLVTPINKWMYIKKGEPVPRLVFSDNSGHMRYAEPEEVRVANNWPEEFRGTVFRGSIWGGFLALELNRFLFAGGYCEQFFGWGDEDAELVDRLEKIGVVSRLYTNEDLVVYHLDHDVPHRKPDALKSNHTIRQHRKKMSLNLLLQQDLNNGDSAVLNSIRFLHPILK